MTWNVDDAINILGNGSVTPESCPRVIPQDQLAEINDTIAFLEDCYDAILGERQGEVVIALTNSPAFSCRVCPLENGQSLILVPLGMPARIRVSARLLLRYWDRESRILTQRSVIDNVSSDDRTVPKLLQPLFLNSPDINNSYWGALDELDNAVEIDPRTESDVRELVYLSFVYLLSHEFTHILHGHSAVYKQSCLENHELSQKEILRGLELDADDGAAAVTMKVLQWRVSRATNAGSQDNIMLAWLRLSYAVTMLFGIFDAQRKYVGEYTEEYNHPLIRRELFSGAVLRCLDASEPIRTLWLQCDNEGWQRCIFAFNDLTLDALRGVFGTHPGGMLSEPFQSLVYGSPGGTATRVEQDLIRDALTLLHQVRKLLPIFRTTER